MDCFERKERLMSVISGYMMPHPPIIIPEIGRGREADIECTSSACRMAAAEIAGQRPETVVVLSPHATMYTDYFHISPGRGAAGSFGRFGARQVRLEAVYDTEFVENLCERAKRRGLSAGTKGERERELDHGTMIPLYFINREYQNYRLVRIGLSGLSLREHYELGRCIKETAEQLGRRTVIVASGDLSHKLREDGPYGCSEEGPIYDRAIMDVMGNAEFGKLFDFKEELLERAAECGHRSFVILAGAMDGRMVETRRLSYEGPFGVGYGVCAFMPGECSTARLFGLIYDRKERLLLERRKAGEDSYVRLARKALEAYVREGRILAVPSALPEALYREKAGVFVSLKKGGRLRGCIGTIGATRESLAEEIIGNAISAGTRDPRFAPVLEDELDKLVYNVDVLGKTEPVSDVSELDVRRYGVIVTRGRRRGLLLPNLEGVDTVEEQIAIAKQKAGISEDTDDIVLERFEVIRHE